MKRALLFSLSFWIGINLLKSELIAASGTGIRLVTKYVMLFSVMASLWGCDQPRKNTSARVNEPKTVK